MLRNRGAYDDALNRFSAAIMPHVDYDLDEQQRMRTMNIVDMPDWRASLLVRLILQNEGTLSKAKRELFRELSPKEVRAIEKAVASAGPVPRPPETESLQ
jgi:hypothetical protein